MHKEGFKNSTGDSFFCGVSMTSEAFNVASLSELYLEVIPSSTMGAFCDALLTFSVQNDETV